MSAPRFIDVFVEPNPNTQEEAGLRFKSESAPRTVARVRLDGRWCSVTGWSSTGRGSPCPARAATIEDSSAGTAVLVFGGDWGLRLQPEDGSPAFGETHLVLIADAVE